MMAEMDRDSAGVVEGADILLRTCGRLAAGERVAIVCDPGTRTVADIVARQATLVTSDVHLVEVPAFGMHGQEPPDAAAAEMRESALCLGLTAKSMIHTAARKNASLAGARYLSLPDYSVDLLADGSLRADFVARGVIGKRIADAYTSGTEVTVSSAIGTKITMRIDGRVGSSAPGYVAEPGATSSPPTIESYVSPIESSAAGVVVVDGSIPFPTLGLIRRPITLVVEGGRVVDVQGPDAETVAELRRVFAGPGSDKAYVLAECAVGLNDRARLSGIMLTDEGTAGTMHFGFGSNATIGGVNEVPFHLDTVLRGPSMWIDGRLVVERGEVRI